ncbi:Tetracycline resistance protein [Ceratobasidium theobromae]|uniref:Tetracycline resistance protein n=1 Tax=Ceratobasidium theobromae TaxID=1582974 RepID=A0A5N5QPV6_9AGAM|nr:Tetracycline resistance protein [Ceratobasidium theobromae]
MSRDPTRRQSRTSEVPLDQEEIKRQIAALEARLITSPDRTVAKPAKEPNHPTKRILVARSPSPKRRKIQHEAQPTKSQAKPNGKPTATSKPIAPPAFNPPSPPRKSMMAQAASAFQAKRASRLEQSKEPVVRSTSFAQPVATERPTPSRNEDMTIKEDLPIGPIDHPAPFDDPRWDRLEPYSGIHLTSRKLPFDEFQEFMYGRVYLSPSRLYSVVRLSPDRSAYDVPVDGDWVTIAVVAERGQVQVSRRGKGGNQGKGKGKDDNPPGNSGDANADNDDEDSRPAPREKKYMRLLLVDFGHRASDGKPNPKEQTKGDALLSMLLFESDSARTEDGKIAKGKSKDLVYKGGSGGAFEECAKLREGAVLAILNPRILKPFQRSNGNPHPRDNALAITPENAKSIAVLGYSRDLGSCRATKRDGQRCGSWCDKRISEVCEYHIQDAIKSKRAARPEFSAGTADLASSKSKEGKFGKPAYDPSRKWGLTPSIGQQNAAVSSESAKLGGGATYIVDGHVLSGHDRGGFDADATRLKGLRKKKEEEWALEEVIRRDGGKTPAAQILKLGAAHLKARKAGANLDDGPVEQLDTASEAPRKVYSAELVKSIGYDPSRRAGNTGRPKENDGVRQLVADSTRSVDLRPAPGTRRIRSNVTMNFAPSRGIQGSQKEQLDASSDSELEIEP